MEGVSPPEVADAIKSLIKGKVVCDVGCGDGTFMQSLDKYAKRVIGVEENYEWAYKAAEKGFEVYPVSAWHQPLPKADVYYLWTKDAQGVYLKAQYEGTKGVVIFGKTVRPSLSRFLQKKKAQRKDIEGLDWWIYVTKL